MWRVGSRDAGKGLHAVAYLCKVAAMAKFKCAPFSNNDNIMSRYNFYER